MLLTLDCVAQVLHQWFVCGLKRVVGLFVWDEPLCLGMYAEFKKRRRERKRSVISLQSCSTDRVEVKLSESPYCLLFIYIYVVLFCSADISKITVVKSAENNLVNLNKSVFLLPKSV